METNTIVTLEVAKLGVVVEKGDGGSNSVHVHRLSAPGMGMSGLSPKWVSLAQNVTSRDFFRSDQISLYFGSAVKSDLKKSQISPILDQSDPLWCQT